MSNNRTETATTSTSTRRDWIKPSMLVLLAAGSIPALAQHGYGNGNNCRGNDISIIKNPSFNCRIW